MNKQGHNGISDGDIAISLRDVSKTFYQRQRSEKTRDVLKNMFRPNIKEIHALKNVNMEINRGEIVAYAGANGAGKSTTVKLLSSVLAPTSGTVRCLGLDPMKDRMPYVKRIGVVFGQRTELWWDQPVATSFEWKRVIWDIPEDRYEAMLDFVKDLLGLGEFFNSLARQLSLGQKMRADLGLMLMHEPEILFLDEPTIGVDVLAKRNILKFIKELNREKGVTVMLTSHDMDELEQLAGRIVMIDHGHIAFDGDFRRLRSGFGDHRYLMLETPQESAPELTGATWSHSEGNRHTFTFDAAQTPIAMLLDRAAQQTQVVDVETHRAPIDDVIADIYEGWENERAD
ncbi:MAG: ATP-binding cassette domain-containing protein [Candidatus Latescibacteria bacterium]|nr:ATP-binding cassette domain-containing protein [Candidatus Latescibacterota bacterium]